MSHHKVTLSQDVQGRVIQNVIHFANPDGLITQQAMAGFMETDWIPQFRPVQWNQTKYFQVEVRQILAGPNPPVFLKTINITGVSNTSKQPALLAWKLRFQTGLAGRTQRGRYFIGGIGFGMLDLNTEQVGSSSIVVFTNIITALSSRFMGASPSTGLHLCIAHKNGDIPSLVSTITLDPNITTMRSRKFGVGI